MTTVWIVLGIVGALWLSAVGFAAWCLWRLSTRPFRPISEHCDEHWYRPHNGAKGRSFR